MEAIAAFGLACNVMQVIECSRTAISLVQQTYQRGAWQENIDLDNVAKRLMTSTDNLDILVSSHSRIGLSKSQIDLELRTLAIQCSSSAKALHEELAYLQSKGGLTNSIRITLRSMRKKGDIERLAKRVEQHQRLLDTGILVSLRERVDATALTQQADFERLDANLRDFILTISAAQSKTENLIKSESENIGAAVQSEHVVTRAQLVEKVEGLHIEIASETSRQRLMNSLRFAEIFARQNQISPPQKDTFEWIFNESLPRPWSSFTEWLCQGKGIYWINGKAGSGKSSLMKFVLNDIRTTQNLQQWCAPNMPQVLSFFFWLVGSPMQKNLHGLLCSIVHQILDGDQASIEILLTRRPELRKKISTWDWASQEVLELLHELVKQRTIQRPICLFLDGLDEFDPDDDFEQLCQLIISLSSSPKVKLCISSRPETQILGLVADAPSLRLQDLTYNDIYHYVSEQIDEFERSNTKSMHLSDRDRKELLHGFIERAGGVFLWTRLAVKDVFRGLRKRDSVKELHRRLSRLPLEIERLYEDMLKRIGPDFDMYKQEAGLYLKTVSLFRPANSEQDNLQREGCYILSCALVAAKYLPESQIDLTPLAKLDEIANRVKCINSRISACCNGLLVVTAPAEQTDSLSYLKDCTVQMAHRSVSDFLQEKPAGRALLRDAPGEDFAIFCAFIQAELFLAARDDHDSQSLSLRHHLRAIFKSIIEGPVSKSYTPELFQFARNCFRQHFASLNNRFFEDNYAWEYEASRIYHWRHIDMIGMVAPIFEYNMLVRLASFEGAAVSTSYKNYLLLCVVMSWLANPSCARLNTEALLRDGTEVNADLYLPVSFPIKCSIWSIAIDSFCYNLDTGMDDANIDIGVTILRKLTEYGANHETRSLQLLTLDREGNVKIDPFAGKWRSIAAKPAVWYVYIIYETNASSLLSVLHQEHIAPYLELDSTEPFVRPLWIWMPPSLDENEKQDANARNPCPGRVVEIPPEASADFLDFFYSFSNLSNMYYTRQRRPTANLIWKVQKSAMQLFDKGPKLGLEKGLEKFGYYRPQSDPAVFQGPIQRLQEDRIIPPKG